MGDAPRGDDRPRVGVAGAGAVVEAVVAAARAMGAEARAVETRDPAGVAWADVLVVWAAGASGDAAALASAAAELGVTVMLVGSVPGLSADVAVLALAGPPPPPARAVVRHAAPIEAHVEFEGRRGVVAGFGPGGAARADEAVEVAFVGALAARWARALAFSGLDDAFARDAVTWALAAARLAADGAPLSLAAARAIIAGDGRGAGTA